MSQIIQRYLLAFAVFDDVSIGNEQGSHVFELKMGHHVFELEKIIMSGKE